MPEKRPNYLVLCIDSDSREVEGTHFAETIEQAVELSNAALKDHMEQIGRLNEFESGDTSGDEFGFADNNGYFGAWCNYSYNWDSYIISLADVAGA